MCGIVVLAGKVPPHIEVIAISGAAARGPNTHGWAFRDEQEGWTVLRYPGRLIYQTYPRISGIRSISKGALYIGHSRLATVGSRPGDAPPLHEAQPYVSRGEFLVAHNGTVPDTVSLRQKGRVDTEMLLAELEAGRDPSGMLGRAGSPQAAVWATGAAVAACRMNGTDIPANPLYVLRGRGWVAVSSGELPAGKLLPAGKVVEIA